MEQLPPWRGGDLGLLSVHERGFKADNERWPQVARFAHPIGAEWPSVRLAAIDHTVDQCYECGTRVCSGSRLLAVCKVASCDRWALFGCEMRTGIRR